MNSICNEFGNELPKFSKDGRMKVFSDQVIIASDPSVDFTTKIADHTNEALSICKSLQSINVKSYAYANITASRDNDPFGDFSSTIEDHAQMDMSRVCIPNGHESVSTKLQQFTENQFLSASIIKKIHMSLDLSIISEGNRETALLLLPMVLFGKGPQIIIITKDDYQASKNCNRLVLKYFKVKSSGLYFKKTSDSDDDQPNLKFIENFIAVHNAKYNSACVINCEAKYKLHQSIDGICEVRVTSNKVELNILHSIDIPVYNLFLCISGEKHFGF